MNIFGQGTWLVIFFFIFDQLCLLTFIFDTYECCIKSSQLLWTCGWSCYLYGIMSVQIWLFTVLYCSMIWLTWCHFLIIYETLYSFRANFDTLLFLLYNFISRAFLFFPWHAFLCSIHNLQCLCCSCVWPKSDMQTAVGKLFLLLICLVEWCPLAW